MAKLIIVELLNKKQAFGKSFYAMFDCLTEDSKRVEVGITHNAMFRKGFDEQDPASIVGCSFVTKEYVDDQTGELVNPEDRLKNILDGDGRLLLLNSINCNIKESELYKTEQRELKSATASKLKMEITKAKDAKMLADSLASLQAKALALSTKQSATPKTLDDVAPAIVEEQPAEVVAEGEEKELEF